MKKEGLDWRAGEVTTTSKTSRFGKMGGEYRGEKKKNVEKRGVVARL